MGGRSTIAGIIERAKSTNQHENGIIFVVLSDGIASFLPIPRFGAQTQIRTRTRALWELGALAENGNRSNRGCERRIVAVTKVRDESSQRQFKRFRGDAWTKLPEGRKES